jgi:hypothetical protein
MHLQVIGDLSSCVPCQTHQNSLDAQNYPWLFVLLSLASKCQQFRSGGFRTSRKRGAHIAQHDSFFKVMSNYLCAPIYDIGISAPPRWRENLIASRKGTNMNRSASSSCNLGFRTNGRSSFGTCAERRCGEVSGCAPQSSLPIRVCLSLMCIALKLPTTSLLVPVRYVQYLVALDYDVRHMDEGIELRHLRCVAAEPISRDWSFVELTLIRQQSRYFDTRHCSPLKPPFFRLRNE